MGVTARMYVCVYVSDIFVPDNVIIFVVFETIHSYFHKFSCLCFCISRIKFKQFFNSFIFAILCKKIFSLA